MSYTIGIIGLGNILHNHASSIAELGDLELTWLCDLAPEKVAHYQAQFGCRGTTDYKELFTDPPDAVVVALPHALHCEVTLAALEAGCHVLVEKPMAVSVDQCRRMIAAARQAGRYLNVSDSGSYEPGAVLTGQRFASGCLGRFFSGVFCNARKYFTDNRPAWFLDPEMSGGGMFSNVGLHRLAVTRRCLPGLTPISVSASVSYDPAYKIEGCTSALVRYDKGGGMHYEELGYFNPPQGWNKERHYIFENGVVTFDSHAWRCFDRDGAMVEEKLSPQKHAGYLPVYQNLLRGIRGEALNGPRVEEYAADTAIAQASYASAQSATEIDLREDRWRIGPGARG